MQFVFDNLIALVVGTVLLGVLAVVAQRQQAESVSLAEHNMAEGQSAAIEAWIQSDLQSATAFTARTDSTLVLSRTSDPASLATIQVEYRRVRKPGTPVRYQIVRREGATERPLGPLVAGWTATLLTASGTVTTSPATARAVRVRVTPALAITGAETSAPLLWERTFTPRMLGSTNV